MPGMKHAALPPLSRDLLEAFTASAWGCLMWLARVITQIGAPRRSRRLRAFVEQLERAVESILFLEAVRRFGPPRARRHTPHGAPAGFRRQLDTRMRLFFRNSGVRARKAGFLQRLASLAAALANPEPHIAYFTKRLMRGLRGARLIAARPPATSLGASAPQAAIIVDTS